MASINQSDLIHGVYIAEPDSHGDSRGRFVETYRRSWFPQGREMVQGNRSEKEAGILVGLHYHLHQADYWYLMRGKIRVVLHDLREGSPTESTTQVIPLDGRQDKGVFIPPGVAHGFSVQEDSLLTYFVDNYYNPEDELGVMWNDPSVDADWGVTDPIISERDKKNPSIADIPAGRKPYFGLRT